MIPRPPTTDRQVRSFAAALRIGMAALVIALPAIGQSDTGDPHAGGWWSEPSQGLRLRPPTGSRQIDHPASGVLVGFVHPDGYRLSVSLRHTQEPINLKRLKARAFDQFSYLAPSSVILNTRFKAPPRMRGAAIMVAAEDDTGQATVRWGQVFIVIDDHNHAVIQLDSSAAGFDAGFAALEKMVASISVMDPVELRRMRATRLEAGSLWLAARRKQPPPRSDGVRWFRVVEAGRDIGYFRQQRITDTEALTRRRLEPGTLYVRQGRIADAGRVFDTEATFYESADRRLEIWELTTTLRKKRPDGKEQTATWVTTGFRTENLIQVTRDEPAELGDAHDLAANPLPPKTSRWPMPPVGYLSQVDLLELADVWPTLDTEVIFYAYDPASGDLTQRTYRAIDRPDGARVVQMHPTPTAPATSLHYDHDGSLRRYQLPTGRQWIATTAAQIGLIWDVQPNLPRRRDR